MNEKTFYEAARKSFLFLIIFKNILGQQKFFFLTIPQHNGNYISDANGEEDEAQQLGN